MPKFTWNVWDIDCNGEAFVVAKRVCPEKENVPEYIVKEDMIHPDCKDDMVVEEGWCKFQVRTDWENGDGEPRGWYVVERKESPTINKDTGKRKPGWFPVWIVRKGEWY